MPNLKATLSSLLASRNQKLASRGRPDYKVASEAKCALHRADPASERGEEEDKVCHGRISITFTLGETDLKRYTLWSIDQRVIVLYILSSLIFGRIRWGFTCDSSQGRARGEAGTTRGAAKTAIEGRRGRSALLGNANDGNDIINIYKVNAN